MTKLGNQVPTKSVLLPSKNSLYQEAVTLYEKSGRKAQEWQKALMKAVMGLNKDGLWTHTKFGYSLPRRNGKNEIVAIRELWALSVGERVLHTAHRTTTSHAAWERLLSLLDKSCIEYKSIRAIGREYVELEDTGGRVDFRTRSSKGGLGEGFDLLVIDEAQEYTEDQESALKYVVTDSKNPQTIFCGTPPTPISSGTVFLNLRNSALAGETQNTGWAEWSVDEQADPQDKKLWYLTNPSLGTIFTERSVADEIGSDVVDFNIQRLGLWLRYNLKSAISENEWEALRVETLPKLTGPLYVGIKYGKDGTNVAMSIAVRTDDDKIFVEAIDCRSVREGNDWILAFLSKADWKTVVIDGSNGQDILESDMRDSRLRSPVLPKVREVVTAASLFEQKLFQGDICHMGQPSLAQVVSNCEHRLIGTNGGFGYRCLVEDYDIALLESVFLAHWACDVGKPISRQKIRY